MANIDWQLKTPISALIFDCDGTLSTIEGIDELANQNGVGEKVKSLTAKAMGESGINPELYKERLHLVNPRIEQLETLGHAYLANCVPDLPQVLRIFQRLHKTIYIVSAGLSPAIQIFAKSLNIADSNIFAVDIQFDAQGNFLDFDRHSPLVSAKGKRTIVSQLKKHHTELVHIGDGLNDLEAYDLVSRFIGFGGVFYREKIANLCNYYIHALSFTPLLPLILTNEESQMLSTAEKIVFLKGLDFISKGKVSIKA